MTAAQDGLGTTVVDGPLVFESHRIVPLDKRVLIKQTMRILPSWLSNAQSESIQADSALILSWSNGNIIS
jgi:hypothetical protein